jgi:adenine-specific DNA-methyltransferase
VRKRDVKHGQDADMIREPEMVKAYRDTWELGLHSYLTYLRDRLLLAKELLTESGSIFVQISDQNLHHVREVMDESLWSGDNVLPQLIAFQEDDRLKHHANSARHNRLPGVARERSWSGLNSTPFSNSVS